MTSTLPEPITRRGDEQAPGRIDHPLRTMFDEPVSPELALVDPALAAYLRELHVPPASPERVRRAPAPAPAQVAPDHGLPPVPPPLGDLRPARTRSFPAPPVDRSEGAARHDGEARRASRRRRWRPRPFEAVTALAFLGLLGAAFLPPHDPPTFAAPARSGQVSLAWPETRASDVYLLQITDGARVVYERRLGRPHLDEVFQLAPGRAYAWRVYLALPSQARSSEPVARGSFVFAG